MSTSFTLENFLYQEFKKLDASQPFYALRQKTFDLFPQLKMSITQNECYKHTPIMNMLAHHPFMKQSNSRRPHVTNTHLDVLPTLIQKEDSYHCVLVNGYLNQCYTNLPEKYLKLYPFQEWVLTHKENMIPYLFQNDDHRDIFFALNTVFFDEGYVLQLSDNVMLDKPLIIYNITMPTSHPLHNIPRLSILIGKNSKVTIIQSSHHIGNVIPSFTNTVTKIFSNERAQLYYYNIQENKEEAYQVTTTQLYQEASSTINHYTFTFGAPLIKNNLIATMQGPYSEAKLYGLYDLQNRHHVDNYIEINHKEPYTTSRQFYKGIISDEATGVFNGQIHVQPVAQRTNALQTNNVLITSNLAKHYTKPQLEIYADDVKCSHGATTEQLDNKQLFYLRSRGIPHKEAHQLLLKAFANEIIQQVPLKSLQCRLTTMLDQSLHKMSIHTT